MRITFEPEKREWTLKVRSLDFAEAAEIFAGPHTVLADDRSTMARQGTFPLVIYGTGWSSSFGPHAAMRGTSSR